MNNAKHTRRALLSSVVALVLCLTMLMGTTFAWFTDTATVKVNTIQSGTLDIDLVAADGETSLEGKTIGFKTYDNRAQNEILWEPGCTYELDEVKLINKGNLHAKFLVTISAVNGETDGGIDLAEVIDVYEGETKLGTLREILNNGKALKEGNIAPNETEVLSFGTISLHMQETAGNDYQDKSIESIAVTVYATQYTAEFDSTTDQYDAGATFPEIVSNQTELNDVIAKAETGKPVTIALPAGNYNLLLKDGSTTDMVGKDVTFTGTKDTVFDLTDIVGATWHTQDTDATITFDGVTVKWNEDNEGYQGFANAEKVVYKDCTIYGTQFMGGDAEFINCVFEAANTTEKGYAVYGRGAGTLTFTGCTFNTDGRALMLYQDQTTEVKVVMTDCTFNDNGNYSSKSKAVVETGDGQYKTSKFDITLTNCTATGFEANNSTSNLWGNKDSIPTDRLNVVIDGVDVY